VDTGIAIESGGRRACSPRTGIASKLYVPVTQVKKRRCASATIGSFCVRIQGGCGRSPEFDDKVFAGMTPDGPRVGKIVKVSNWEVTPTRIRL